MQNNPKNDAVLGENRGRFSRLLAALLESDPVKKCSVTRQIWSDWQEYRLLPELDAPLPVRLESPGRPEKPVLVAPKALPRRGLGSKIGVAALTHAVAHIEFNAINLALDAAYRFRQMPEAFVGDWLCIAADEARHFLLLTDCLSELGYDYGDFPAHNGLWEMACKTDHDVLLRMALVPRVLEARGLDVTPGMISRLRVVGEHGVVKALEIILREEVSHVAAGSRWYFHLCHDRGLDPTSTFQELVRLHAPGSIRGPFHIEARKAAGFSEQELSALQSIHSPRR